MTDVQCAGCGERLDRGQRRCLMCGRASPFRPRRTAAVIACVGLLLLLVAGLVVKREQAARRAEHEHSERARQERARASEAARRAAQATPDADPARRARAVAQLRATLERVGRARFAAGVVETLDDETLQRVTRQLR